MLQDRGALPKEKGIWAMHEANFLSCWLKEVGEDKKARDMDIVRDTKEEVSEERVREEEKEENGTVSVERRCVNSVSAEAFDVSAKGRSWRAVVI